MNEPKSATKQQTLIDEYDRLLELNGFTPQTRGQRFNGLIAETLSNYRLRARPNNSGHGEVDVAFEMNGTRFLLEAKWEKKRLSEDPIIKLRDRVTKRLAGTVGVLLSMSGYTQKALKEMTYGQRLEVVLLEREHFEALIYGYLSPSELFSAILDNAHFHGHPLTPIAELRKNTHDHISVDWTIDVTPDLFEMQSDDFEIKPLFSVEGFCGNMFECEDGSFLLSQKDGTIRLKESEQRPTVELGVPIPGRFWKTTDGFITIKHHCLGKFLNKKWCFELLAPRFRGISRLISADWIFTHGHPGFSDGRPATPASLTNIDTWASFGLETDCRDACIMQDKVYAFHETKGFYCFDLQGKLEWNRSISKKIQGMIAPLSPCEIVIISQRDLWIYNVQTNEAREIFRSKCQLLEHSFESHNSVINFGIHNNRDNAKSFFRLNRKGISFSPA